MIAFVVFGAFSTLALYNERKITANTLKDENIEFLSYAKNYEYEEKILFTDAETGELIIQDGTAVISPTGMTKEEYASLLKKYPGAIGARSADIFMIFWAEALMVALACLILSLAVTAIICPALNKVLLETDLISISVMDFGWLNALMMTAVSVVTATIATVIPVLIYSKKPPVNSIRAL